MMPLSLALGQQESLVSTSKSLELALSLPFVVASRLAEAGLQTLLLEAGGPSYGVTGGNLTARRPVCLPYSHLSG